MRVATIDIGTNTVLLLIAERAENGLLHAVTDCATITRLGEGVDRTRELSSRAVARTFECLTEYARVIREADAARVVVAGTSAMRDAGGGEELCAHVRALLGIDVRVLSGDEEARLTFRGAIGGLSIQPGEAVAVFDVGGGSTEVVIGRTTLDGPTIDFSRSHDVGSVRLTERYLIHDPPLADEQDRVTRAAGAVFADVPPLPSSKAPVGVAGTMTTLAAVCLGLSTYNGARVHGRELSVSKLKTLIARLTTFDLDARKHVLGMEPKRADVIVAGGLVALSLLEHWEAKSVRISDRGVRWGLAEELLLKDVRTVRQGGILDK